MKLKRKIVMLLALVMAIATVFSVMAINASAEENATETQTEVVPDYNHSSITTNAFQVFILDKTTNTYDWVSSAGTFVTALTTARNHLNGSTLVDGKDYVGGKAWIYVKSNTTNLGSNNFNTANNINGTVTVDLNNCVIDAYNRNYFVGFNYITTSSSDADEFTSAIKFMNGTIRTVKARPIVYIYGDSDTDHQYDKTKQVEVTFDNIVFERSTKTTDETGVVLVQAANNSSKAYGYSADNRLNANVSFNNCSFNYNRLASIKFLADTTGKDDSGDFVNVNINVNGATITANEYLTDLYYLETAGNDSITLGKGSKENYTTVTLPATAAVPAVYGADMAFVKASEDTTAGTVTYKLMPAAVANFAPKSNITLWSDFGYNIYLPKVDELNYVAVNGAEKTIADLALETLGEVQYYKIAIPVKSFEALNDIAVTVKLTANGENYGGTFNFSVYGYATTVIAGDYAEAEKALAKDMLSYSAAAYVNFEKESIRLADVTSLLGADYDAEYVPSGTAKAPAEGVVTGFTGVTLYLGETPTFRFTFDGATAPEYKYYMGSHELEAKVVVDEEANKGYVDIAVYAHMMTRDLTVKDAETETEIFTYNVFDYYTKAEGNVKKLVERLIKYAESAKAYRDTFQVAE